MDNRQRILNSAVAMVRAHGFRAVKKRHVALNAKVAPTLINYYWGCVESLRIDVIKFGIEHGDVVLLAHARYAGLLDASRVHWKLRPRVERMLKRIPRLILN